jgi:hypothetical protein
MVLTGARRANQVVALITVLLRLGSRQGAIRTSKPLRFQSISEFPKFSLTAG